MAGGGKGLGGQSSACIREGGAWRREEGPSRGAWQAAGGGGGGSEEILPEFVRNTFCGRARRAGGGGPGTRGGGGGLLNFGRARRGRGGAWQARDGGAGWRGEA